MAMEDWTPLEIDPEGIGGPEELVERLEAMGPGELTDLLTEEKAVVFRGFDITSDTLDDILGLVLPDRAGPARRPARRDRIGGGLRTAAEDRPHVTVQPHNEMSHSHAWPTRLALYCHTASTTGGATVVVDGERWLAALEPELRERFAPGVRYVRYLHDGPGLGESWQDAFGTTHREEVEVFLDCTGAEWSWKADGGIQVAQIRPATVLHPVTGAEVWFNQAHRWYPPGHGDDTGDALARILPGDVPPRNVTFSDGSPIPQEYVLQISDRGFARAVDIEWNRGDLMLLDNVALAHGRRPFTGRRRICMAMSD
ncbi:TauD/TfdA family dioxygenase [Streptomyces sp. NPDC059989]|uniref:TauD/TfdA family dioxygenase n=1 Tax=Streptomyces sp. NPDC059989 TaxID=3347026 RepID=UPI00368C3605